MNSSAGQCHEAAHTLDNRVVRRPSTSLQDPEGAHGKLKDDRTPAARQFPEGGRAIQGGRTNEEDRRESDGQSNEESEIFRYSSTVDTPIYPPPICMCTKEEEDIEVELPNIYYIKNPMPDVMFPKYLFLEQTVWTPKPNIITNGWPHTADADGLLWKEYQSYRRYHPAWGGSPSVGLVGNRPRMCSPSWSVSQPGVRPMCRSSPPVRGGPPQVCILRPPHMGTPTVRGIQHLPQRGNRQAPGSYPWGRGNRPPHSPS